MTASDMTTEAPQGVPFRWLVILRLSSLLCIATAVGLLVLWNREPRHPEAALTRAEELLRLGGEANLHQARKLFRSTLPSPVLSPAVRSSGWVSLGYVESLLGDLDAEMAAYREALAVARPLGDLERKASILNDLGRALRLAGRFGEARASYDEALATAKAAGIDREQAAALNNLGMLDYSQGDAEAAIRLYRQALSLWQHIGDRHGAAVTLSNLGEAYFLLGRPEDAVDLLESSLKNLDPEDEPEAAAATWTALGWARFDLDDAAAALDAYHTAIALQERAGDVAGQAGTLDRLGTAYRKLRQYEAAQRTFERSLRISQRSGVAMDAYHTLFNLCELFVDWNRLAEAERYCAEARGASSGQEDLNAAAHGWYLTASIAYQRGQLEQATQAIENAVTLVEDLRETASSRAFRASFFAARRSYFDFYLDLLLQRHTEEPTAGWDRAALVLSERVRTLGLVEMILDAQDIIAGSHLSEQQLQARQQDFRRHMESLLSPTPGEDCETETRWTDLRSLRRQRDESWAETLRPAQRSPTLSEVGPPGLADIQGALADGDTIVLFYAVGERSSILWLVSAEHPESHILPGRASMTRLAQTLQSLLNAPPRRSEEAPTRLALRAASRELLGPVAARLGSRRIIVVPDGPLHLIPFAALPVPAHDAPTEERPLVVGHEISYLPSVSAYLAATAPREARVVVERDLLVVADPVLSRRDPRLAASPTLLQDPRAAVDTERWPETGWSRLPGSRKEALQVLRVADSRNATTLLDFAASRARVLEELPHHRIIHVATHVQINERFPDLSGVVLSLYDPQGTPIPGFLRVQDLYGLRLSADLVVLSGCRTAYGTEQFGEGLVGLSQALMIAGTRQLVANLWNSDDEATSELMTRFYGHLIDESASPAEALRKAQQDMLGSERWSAPHYWAGFRLVGSEQTSPSGIHER